MVVLGKELVQQEYQKQPWELFGRKEEHMSFGLHLPQHPPRVAAAAGGGVVVVLVLIDPWLLTVVCFVFSNYSVIRMLKLTHQGI